MFKQLYFYRRILKFDKFIILTVIITKQTKSREKIQVIVIKLLNNELANEKTYICCMKITKRFFFLLTMNFPRKNNCHS